MSTRDELHTALNRDEFWDTGEAIDSFLPFRAATVLHAEGWRKKPSREEIARWVWKRRIGPNGDESFDYLLAREARGVEGVPQGIWDEADAVLALMDRGQ